LKKIALLLTAVTAMVLGMVVYVGGASAAEDEVCPGTKADVGDLPATIDGVIITLVDSGTVHFDIPEGSTVQVCVKAGSAEQGEGPEFFTLTADADLDASSGKELSHVSVISITTTTTTSPPAPPPTTTTNAPPPPSSTTTTAPGAQTPGPGGAGTVTKDDTTSTQDVVPPSKTQTPSEELAFTGPESVVPIGAIALFLASAGSGLMWLSSKRKRDEE
jgi:hypothetical protein